LFWLLFGKSDFWARFLASEGVFMVQTFILLTAEKAITYHPYHRSKTCTTG